jgi:hypothetical protein
MANNWILVYAKGHCTKKGENIYHCSFVCLKNKKFVIRDCDKSSILERHRAIVGTECKAGITIGDNDFTGTWVVCTINVLLCVGMLVII